MRIWRGVFLTYRIPITRRLSIRAGAGVGGSRGSRGSSGDQRVKPLPTEISHREWTAIKLAGCITVPLLVLWCFLFILFLVVFL